MQKIKISVDGADMQKEATQNDDGEENWNSSWMTALQREVCDVCLCVSIQETSVK